MPVFLAFFISNFFVHISVNRIKTETGTSIIIPPDGEKSDMIRIEGDPMGVKAAKTMLLEMAAKMVMINSRAVRFS